MPKALGIRNRDGRAGSWELYFEEVAARESAEPGGQGREFGALGGGVHARFVRRGPISLERPDALGPNRDAAVLSPAVLRSRDSDGR